MKKALIVILILAVAGGLFAQEWGGGVTTGLKIDLKDDVPVTANDDDSGDAVHASLWFEHAEDEWGVKITTSASVPGGLDVGNAWGWINFADGLLKLSAGKTDDGVWGSGGRYDKDVSDGLGVRLDVKPIDGLNFGFRLGYPNDGSSAGKIGNFFQETAIGVKYSADSWFAVTALKLHSEESDDYDKMNADWYFGVGYTGLDSFGFYLDGGIDYLATMSDDGKEALAEKVTFSGVENLGLTLGLTEKFVQSFKFDGLDAEINVDYAFDAVSVGADASTAFNKDFKPTGFGFDAWAKYAIGNAWLKGVIGADIATKDFGDSTDPYFKLVFGFDF